jgi:tetratricopeptide (TPR) repeat protein
MEQVLRTEPSLADAYFIRGEAYRHLGLIDEAEAEYELALTYNPTHAEAHLGLARIHMIRDPNLLSDEYSKAISFNQGLLPAYLEQADFLTQHGQWIALEELARNGLRPGRVNSPLLQLYHGKALYYLGRYEEALDIIMLATSNDESILEAYYLQGITLIGLGRYEESTSPLMTYLAYASEDVSGWNAIAASYYNLYEFDLAEEAYTYVLVLDEFNFIALYSRGLLFMDLDRYEEALADFDQAREIDPQSDSVEFARARAFFALNQPESALESLELIFSRSLEPNILADAYKLQALYFVNQSPPYISEAISNWETILGLENVSESRKQRAQTELEILTNFP